MRRFLFLIILVIPSFVFAQIANIVFEKTKNIKRQPGFFTFFVDDATGKIRIVLDKVGQEFRLEN